MIVHDNLQDRIAEKGLKLWEKQQEFTRQRKMQEQKEVNYLIKLI